MLPLYPNALTSLRSLPPCFSPSLLRWDNCSSYRAKGPLLGSIRLLVGTLSTAPHFATVLQFSSVSRMMSFNVCRILQVLYRVESNLAPLPSEPGCVIILPLVYRSLTAILQQPTRARARLSGQCLAVLSLACARGPRFIAVAPPDGRRRLIRRAVTDLERPTTVQVPVPRISARTLLPLARYIQSVVTASGTEIVHALPFPQSCTPTPGISRHDDHVFLRIDPAALTVASCHLTKWS